jgi:hypothetical protein
MTSAHGRLTPVLLAVATTCAACAHVEVNTRNEDKFIERTERLGAPKGKVRYSAECAAADDRLMRCTVESEDACDQTTYEAFDRTTIEERSTSTLAKVIEYAGAGLLVGAGLGFTIDAGNVPSSDDRLSSNPVGQAGAYGIGGGLLGLGVGFLAFGVTDSVRAMDETQHVGRVEVAGASAEVPCHREKVEGVAVDLVVGGKQLFSARTGPGGRLDVQLAEAIPASAVSGNAPLLPLTLRISGQLVQEVDISKFQQSVCRDSLKKAMTSDLKGIMDFFSMFPNAAKLLSDDAGIQSLVALATAKIKEEYEGKNDSAALREGVTRLEDLRLVTPGNQGIESLHSELSRRAEMVEGQEKIKGAEESLKLARGQLKKGLLDEARRAAEECLQFLEEKKECKELLSQVEALEEKNRVLEEQNRVIEERYRPEVVTGILGSNIFMAFEELGSENDTPLKQKVFLKSEAARDYKKKLDQLKAETLRKTFFIDVGFIFGSYDLKTKSFTVMLSERPLFEFEVGFPFARNNIDDCIFRQLDIRWVEKYEPNDRDPFGVTTTRYFKKLIVKVPEDKAVEIEKNAEDIKVMAYFKVKAQMLNSKTISEGAKTVDTRYPEAVGVEIRFERSDSHEIYFVARFK